MSDAQQPADPYVAPGGVQPPEAVASSAMLSDVRELLKERVQEKWAVFAVPSKPTITLKCHTTLPWNVFQQFNRAAVNKDTDDIDSLMIACKVIEYTNVEIRVNSQRVLEPDGKPLTVADEAFRQNVNALDTVQAIRSLFGGDIGDGAIIQIGNAIVTRAGYGAVGASAEPVELSDPTSAS